MKLSLKLLFSALLFLTFSSHALEEPPGSESIADGDRYIEQLAKDRAAGKIHMDKGIEKSWEQSIVFIPGSSRQRSIMGLQLDKKYPTVIYLHGCGGISRWNDNRWGQFISELGLLRYCQIVLQDQGEYQIATQVHSYQHLDFQWRSHIDNKK
jgi:hypothetical protein